jgi:heme o synthase
MVLPNEQGAGRESGPSGISAYVSLAKPGLTLMSVGTAVAGALLAPRVPNPVSALVLVAAGTLLLGSGCVALNQFLERDYDRMMRRTRNRPIPTGRIAPRAGLLFGSALAAAGITALAFTTLLAMLLGIVTLLSYVFVYTPMKRRSHFATAVGGLPGAIPPVIGWTAMTGSFSAEAYVLFLVVFLWQMPHFLALGWMYRQDYAAGGYRLLPSLDGTGHTTARIILVYTAALLPASVLPMVLGMTGWTFLVLDVIAWLAFFLPVLGLVRSMTDENARNVFHASLLYVPAFFASIGIDRILNL